MEALWGQPDAISELFLTSFLGKKNIKLFFVWPCVEQGIEHDDPFVSLTTQDIL